jgi:hypothetical protein
MVLCSTRWAIVAALAVLGVVAIVGVCVVVPQQITTTMSDFSTLWTTADALQHHVLKNGQWPQDWNTLKPSLAYIDPRYSDGDISFLEERVEVNFGINMESSLQDGEWYVRLKSGRMEPEEDAADERIRNVIAKMTETSN